MIYKLDADASKAKIGDRIMDTKVKFDPDGEPYDTGDRQESGIVLDSFMRDNNQILYVKFEYANNRIKRTYINITKDIDSGLCRYRLILEQK